MLAFDIETFGLNPLEHDITVVALYGTLSDDGDDSEKKSVNSTTRVVDTVLNFQQYPERRNELCKTLVCYLNEAKTLFAFNGHRFDIPFIMHSLNVPTHICEKWLLKLYDPFEESKLMNDVGTKLSNVLKRLNLEDKTASGLEAVRMAKDKEWTTLEDYCKKDAQLTYEVCVSLLKTGHDALGNATIRLQT